MGGEKSPTLLVTMGEPAGIGPELLVRVSQLDFKAKLITLADPDLLLEIAERLKIPLAITLVDCGVRGALHSDTVAKGTRRNARSSHKPNHLYVEPVELKNRVICGQLDEENAPATLGMLSRASGLALSGSVDAIITAPVHKANLNKADNRFLGHTEFFAQAANIDTVVMMLATNGLRVALVTTHLPLLEVSPSITAASLEKTLLTLFDAFSRFGLSQPQLAVCGLNPHAGEDGLLGDEDRKIISPVVKKLQKAGHCIFGPFPADTLFTPPKRKIYDVFLAMYHDQGLPVVKALGFGQCANVTLGLPYIRTSVDHGTALDIAPSYSASANSLQYAIDYAIALAINEVPG